MDADPPPQGGQDCMPIHRQSPMAKQDLHAIYAAEDRQEAEKALDRFVAKYGAKYGKAAACLTKDRDRLLAFYDFPAEH